MKISSFKGPETIHLIFKSNFQPKLPRKKKKAELNRNFGHYSNEKSEKLKQLLPTVIEIWRTTNDSEEIHLERGVS